MTDLFAKPLNLIVFTAQLAVMTLAFMLVPLDQSLPIHWGINGQPDAFAPATLALILPVGFSLLVLGTGFLAARAKPDDMVKGRSITSLTTTLLLAIFLMLQAILLLVGLGQGVDVPRFVAIAIGVLLVGLGNVLPKSQPNSIAGVRLTWTLADANNWRVTNLWAGRLMMLGGLVLLVAAAFTNDAVTLASLLAMAVLVPAFASVAISYRIAKKA